ncbi:MAG TPA: zeta toxin family protein [Acidimicrobiales bacterium]
MQRHGRWFATARWSGEEARHAYEASALAAEQRSPLIAERVSFSTETVFSHPSRLELMRTACDAGYLVTLHVVAVPVELAVARVVERVGHGEHAVPEVKVRDRFARLWGHVRQALDLADAAHIFDNSRAATPYREVARYRDGVLVGTAGWPSWVPKVLRVLDD